MRIMHIIFFGLSFNCHIFELWLRDFVLLLMTFSQTSVVFFFRFYRYTFPRILVTWKASRRMLLLPQLYYSVLNLMFEVPNGIEFEVVYLFLVSCTIPMIPQVEIRHRQIAL